MLIGLVDLDPSESNGYKWLLGFPSQKVGKTNLQKFQFYTYPVDTSMFYTLSLSLIVTNCTHSATRKTSLGDDGRGWHACFPPGASQLLGADLELSELWALCTLSDSI